MRTKGRRFSVNSGISLFLVLLIIMCLVSFASLSLTSAMADMRLSDKYAQQVEWYYGARNEAQKDLAALNTSEPASASPIASETAPDGRVTRHYSAGDVLQLTVVFAPITKAPEDSGSSEGSGSGSVISQKYHVVSEKLESTADYELDESLHVMLSGND